LDFYKIHQIEFLIDEYSTGGKVKTSFREKNNSDKYEKHVCRINEWVSLNERVTTNIRARLYHKLMCIFCMKSCAFGAEPIIRKRAGAPNNPPATTSLGMSTSMREKAQEALNSRTGETDSEKE
jgi:hypothetical protein